MGSLNLEYIFLICKLFSFVLAQLLIWFFFADFKPRFSGGEKTKTVPIIVGVVVGFCLIFSVLAIFWWRCCFRKNNKRQKGLGYFRRISLLCIG